MFLGVTSVFFASLAGIVLLFGLKAWEEGRENPLAPRFRRALDSGALWCKELLNAGEMWLTKVPSLTAYLTLSTLAFSAVGFARLARAASEAAHKLADFVSHKRNFERRETRSEFLKQVIEHKNGLNGNGNKKKAQRNVDARV